MLCPREVRRTLPRGLLALVLVAPLCAAQAADDPAAPGRADASHAVTVTSAPPDAPITRGEVMPRGALRDAAMIGGRPVRVRPAADKPVLIAKTEPTDKPDKPAVGRPDHAEKAAAHAEKAPEPVESRPVTATKSAAAAAPAGPADAASAASAAAAAASAEALERLRLRLAERLGARPVASSSTFDVRVATRTPDPTAAMRAAAVRSAAVRPAAATVPGTVSEPVHDGAIRWSYDGEAGPAAWSRLKPEYATCARGSRQSPIDIRDGFAVQLEPVKFDYRPSGFRVIDNGHTVQVNVGAGNAIEVGGRRYELVQFHFHRPSEERINGRQYDMAAHLVHKDAEGRLAVVAVLLDRGRDQPIVQTVWNNLPLEKGEEVAAPGALDLAALLPEDRRYYTYMGSLTTPPCSEGVLWIVLKVPVPVSAQQIAIFSRLYPMNARPVQASAGRMIKESE